MTRRSLWLSIGLVLFTALASAPGRGEAKLAIGGYDPVAYFTDGKPVRGDPAIEYVWHDARWRFASTAHRDLFSHDPEHYAPQYDGYCAMGVSRETDAHKDTPDPESWAIVDGKLYLTHGPQALAKWRENNSVNISRGDRNWSEVKKQSVVYDGYPKINGTQ